MRPFCSHLDEDAIWVLVNACRMVRCEPSKVLLVEDESADDMYVVEVGACDVTTESEGPIDCKTHAQYYGEEACLKDEPLQASLISSDESITWALDAETLRRTVGPEFDLEEQSSPEPSQKNHRFKRRSTTTRSARTCPLGRQGGITVASTGRGRRV